MGAIERGDMNRLDGCEACFNQQHDLPLIRESGDDTAMSGWIASCREEPAGAGECELECHLLVKELSPHGCRVSLQFRSMTQVACPRVFRQQVKRLLGSRISRAKKCFEDRQG